jgi:hypothetical protein
MAVAVAVLVVVGDGQQLHGWWWWGEVLDGDLAWQTGWVWREAVGRAMWRRWSNVRLAVGEWVLGDNATTPCRTRPDWLPSDSPH